jgi:predicted N-formylglutamate amidohydrolase
MTYQPYYITGADRPSRWVITVDHAANTVPEDVNGGDLGLAKEDMQRHIAYDIGAKGVALALGDLLNAPVICSNFSRLVIDPNRGETDPTLVMRLYDGTVIPANAEIDSAEEVRRRDAYYRPYHAAVDALLSAREDPVVLAIHSMTAQLKGRPKRPWEVAVLHADGFDTRNLGPHVVRRLAQESDLTVGDNQPYFGHLPGDAVDRHALQRGRANCLIEVRQDLISNEAGQQSWAARLAPILTDALNTSGL